MHFVENFDQKTAFFRRVLPPQNFGAKDALGIIFGLVSRKLITQNSSKGDPLGRQGVESLNPQV